jgi:Uracil DNA glycosylase superfamily
MPQLEEIWEKYNADFPAEDARLLKLIKVPKMLPGTAAFPVSAGLIRKKGSEEIPAFPTHGVMFVGNDPDSVCNYKERTRSGFSNGDREQPKLMRYWRGVYRLLDLMTARGPMLSQSDCFFTNVYAALRDGDQNTGGSRAKSKFRDWCLEFVAAQVCIMAPRLIVIFGAEARKAFGLSGNEMSELRVCDTRICAHTDTSIQQTRIVCLWHPSRRLHPGYSSQADVENYNADRLAEAMRDVA